MSHTLVLPAEHLELRRLRSWLEKSIGPSAHAEGESVGPLDLDLIGKIELAIHEVATNIIDHADTSGQNISIEIHQSPLVLRVELRDHGKLAALPLPGELGAHPRVRGYGMMIVELLASRVAYHRVDEVNVWSIEFDLTAS